MRYCVFQIIFILQDLKSNINEADNGASGRDGGYKGDWVESVAFLKDASQQIAATGTVNGDIYIWDVSKKVIDFCLIIYNWMFKRIKDIEF